MTSAHRLATASLDPAWPRPDNREMSKDRTPFVVLAVCGSLRAGSINAMLLRALRRLAPSGVRVELDAAVGQLPLFNPDLEPVASPAVTSLYAAVERADALLIASPEYAHGISGTLKNGLDWLVGFEPFINKPVAVINASPRAHHADDALREILRTMSAGLVGDTSFVLPLLGAQSSEDDMVASAEVRVTCSQAFASLLEERARQIRGGVPTFSQANTSRG
jgi:chromate reductase